MVSNSADLIDVCKQRLEYGEKTSHVLTETWSQLSLEVYLKDLSFLKVLNVSGFPLPWVKLLLNFPAVWCVVSSQRYSLMSIDFTKTTHNLHILYFHE